MKLWMSLYAMIWVLFLEFLLAMNSNAPVALESLHVAPGLVTVGLAYYNFNGLRETAVPARVKRIASVHPSAVRRHGRPGSPSLLRRSSELDDPVRGDRLGTLEKGEH